jgi:hypothetical protein
LSPTRGTKNFVLHPLFATALFASCLSVSEWAMLGLPSSEENGEKQ